MSLEVMKEFDCENEPQKRRSVRLSPSQTNLTVDNKMAPSDAFVKRRITVKKIAPRKTTLAPSENNKENTPKRAVSEEILQKKQKDEEMPLEVMKELDGENERPKRRSARLSPTQMSLTGDNKDVSVKRRITVKKIAPRKTTLALSEQNKENTPKRAVSEGVQEKKQKLSTLDHVQTRNSSSGKKPKKSTMPSPILPSPPALITKVRTRAKTPQAQTPKHKTPQVQTPKHKTPQAQTQNQDPSLQPDPMDEVWSQKVRRSYSRLSDKSLNSPNSRLTLFGFEKLQTPEVIRKDVNKTSLEASVSFSTLTSFTSLLEAEDYVAEPDLNIPGVVVVKEKKKKRKKVQQIDTNEMEELAAKMNAEFEEAEEFELFVE